MMLNWFIYTAAAVIAICALRLAWKVRQKRLHGTPIIPEPR